MVMKEVTTVYRKKPSHAKWVIGQGCDTSRELSCVAIDWNQFWDNMPRCTLIKFGKCQTTNIRHTYSPRSAKFMSYSMSKASDGKISLTLMDQVLMFWVYIYVGICRSLLLIPAYYLQGVIDTGRPVLSCDLTRETCSSLVHTFATILWSMVYKYTWNLWES